MKKQEWMGEVGNVNEDYLFDYSYGKIIQYCRTLPFPKVQLSYLLCVAERHNQDLASGESKWPSYMYFGGSLEAEIARLKRLSKESMPQKDSKKKLPNELKDTLNKPDEVAKLLKEFLSKGNINNRRTIAAKTLIATCKSSGCKADGAKVARFFYEKGIENETKLSTLKEYFKKEDLAEIPINSELKENLLKLI